MPITGLGLFPCGLGYLGLSGVPASVDDPGPADGVAFVNQNGDYEVDGTGDLIKTTPTAQRAMLLLRTVKGSVMGDPTLGFDPPQAIDQSFEYRMQRAVNTALNPMTSDGSIRITKIDVTRTTPRRASLTVTYLVLSTGLQEIVRVL